MVSPDIDMFSPDIRLEALRVLRGGGRGAAISSRREARRRCFIVAGVID